MTAHPVGAPQAGDDPAAQHLALHSRYLESQLQVAEALLGLVTEHGLDHPQLPGIAESIKDQSIAIGSAHARAAEVLARLTELELGLGSAPGHPGYTPAQFPVAPARSVPAPAPSAPRELAGQRYAIGAVPPPAPLVEPAPPVQLAPPAAPQPAAPQPAAPQPVVPQPDAPQPAGVDAATLRAALVAIVADKTGYPPDMVDPSMDLESELGVDSIKRVQVIGAVQDQFDGLPTVGPEQLSELRTLDMVVDFMTEGAADADPKAQSTQKV